MILLPIHCLPTSHCLSEPSPLEQHRTSMVTVQVQIQSSHTVIVIPSQPTPKGNFPLSYCEQIKVSTHGSQLYFYKPSSKSHDASNMYVETLRTSLSQALVHYYPFAGRLSWINGSHMELHCNAMGVPLLEANCDASFADFGDFAAPSQIQQQFVPMFDYSCPIEQMPLMMAQLTRFQCGGLVLGVAFCRALVDGAAAASFVKSWANLASGESSASSEIPFHDRTLLNSLKLHTPSRFHHFEFDPPPLWLGTKAKAAPHGEDKTGDTLLKLTKAQVEKLKKKVHNFDDKKPDRPYTSFEVITGHLWKCVCKARYCGNGEQPTRLSTLVNCRNRLKPPLPGSYFGNATFLTVTPTCSFDEIMQKPVSFAVKNVRQAVERMSDEYVRSALAYIAQQRDMNSLRYPSHASVASTEGPFSGNPNMYIVSWKNFGFYDADFGWGKPVHMGPGPINSDGKTFIMDNGDGFNVAICLQASQLNALNKLFYEDIEEELLHSSKL